MSEGVSVSSWVFVGGGVTGFEMVYVGESSAVPESEALRSDVKVSDEVREIDVVRSAVSL